MPPPPPSSDRVAQARSFAISAHGPQQYGPHPYVFHLDAVADLLHPYGEDAHIIGYLHDVVEDTPTPIERIREEFGAPIAECVALVTDHPGPTRVDRKALTNAKLAAVDGEARLALIVNAADRLANLQMSARGPDSKLEMYRREHPAFRQAAYRPGLCDDLWAAMERILAPALDA